MTSNQNNSLLKVLGTLVPLVWPWARWVMVADVLVQLMLMLHRWNVPGAAAGWTFILHFAMLVALELFVSMSRSTDADKQMRR